MEHMYQRIHEGFKNDPVEDRHRRMIQKYKQDQDLSKKKDKIYVHRNTKDVFVVHHYYGTE